MIPINKIFFGIILLSLSINMNCLAQNELFDQSFASNGISVSNIGANPCYFQDVSLQSDGKIVAVGSISNNAAIIRFNEDGSFDPNFGNNGVLISNFLSGSVANSVAIQTDGKILITGSNNYNLFLARFTKEGTLDSTFNYNGYLLNSYFDGFNQAYSMALQPDGKILVCGRAHYGLNDAMLILRFTSLGEPDSTFNLNGILLLNLTTGTDEARCISIQQDGKIVISGGSMTVINQTHVVVVRLNENGTLDLTFNGSGVVNILASENGSNGYSHVIQNDGKIVIGSFTWANYNHDIVLIRLDSLGNLDSTFGTNGITIRGSINIEEIGDDIAIQSDGKILVGGHSVHALGIYRFNNNGSIDDNFAVNGKFEYDYSVNLDNVNSIIVQPDGRILAVGFGNYNLLILRLGFSAVPVELSLFTAKYESNSILIRWETLSENSNLGFYVEKSLDSKNWFQIGFVNGNLTTTEKHDYKFNDQSLFFPSYYRLRQIDANGDSNLSNIVEINDQQLTNSKMFSIDNVYPNPFNPSTNISINLPNNGDVTLKIYSILGELICEYKYSSLNNGKNILTITNNNLSSGTYFFKVFYNDKFLNGNFTYIK